MKWLRLIGWIVLCVGLVGGVSGYLTAHEVGGWYQTLAKPSFNPPDWVFGPVWTMLFVMMAVAAWIYVEKTTGKERNNTIAVFLLQLALNFMWSIIFFKMHEIGKALIEVLLLWAMIALSAALFRKRSKLSGLLMLPYLGWVSFATVLNGALWVLNRR